MIKKCPKCDAPFQYSEKWDAKYCANCNIWLEKKCGCTPEDNKNGIIECAFECWNRPDTPFESLEDRIKSLEKSRDLTNELLEEICKQLNEEDE